MGRSQTQQPMVMMAERVAFREGTGANMLHAELTSLTLVVAPLAVVLWGWIGASARARRWAESPTWRRLLLGLLPSWIVMWTGGLLLFLAQEVSAGSWAEWVAVGVALADGLMLLWNAALLPLPLWWGPVWYKQRSAEVMPRAKTPFDALRGAASGELRAQSRELAEGLSRGSKRLALWRVSYVFDPDRG